MRYKQKNYISRNRLHPLRGVKIALTKHHFHSFILGSRKLFLSQLVMWSVCIEQHNEKTLLKGIKGFSIITDQQKESNEKGWTCQQVDNEDEEAKDVDVDLIISSKTKIKEFYQFKFLQFISSVWYTHCFTPMISVWKYWYKYLHSSFSSLGN